MDFFKFGLEQKLDHHSCVEFHGDSDGNGFKAQKPIIDPLIEYEILGEGSQICHYCLRRGGRVSNHNFWREKGPKFQFFDSELLAGEGSQITTNWREKGLK